MVPPHIFVVLASVNVGPIRRLVCTNTLDYASTSHLYNMRTHMQAGATANPQTVISTAVVDPTN